MSKTAGIAAFLCSLTAYRGLPVGLASCYLGPLGADFLGVPWALGPPIGASPLTRAPVAGRPGRGAGEPSRVGVSPRRRGSGGMIRGGRWVCQVWGGFLGWCGGTPLRCAQGERGVGAVGGPFDSTPLRSGRTGGGVASWRCTASWGGGSGRFPHPRERRVGYPRERWGGGVNGGGTGYNGCG